MPGWGWSVLRFVAFWTIAFAAPKCASLFLSFVNPDLVLAKLFEAIHESNIEIVSKSDFAYALAGSLFFFAVGTGFAFFILHIAPPLRTLHVARRRVVDAGGGDGSGDARRTQFAANFQTLSQTLGDNWLIGHAWSGFEDTLVPEDGGRTVGSTVRPQAFFNPSVARERLSGLKMMGAVPGYFVGIGLLLTFVGLVLALYKAGAAASAGNAATMATEMGHLLEIATFKFSTSIAGLLASILLSIIFRVFSILLEGAFDSFNAALEHSLKYHAPQSISLQIHDTLRDQLVQLKDITQGDFFARMGAEMAPRLQTAVAAAMAPVSEQIGQAVGSLTTNSQSGMEQLLRSFTEQLQHGAGTEMRELAGTLQQLQGVMQDMQGGLRGSGADFSARLSEAADNLNRMVERAGQTFEQSSGQSRDALAAVVDSLRQTLEKANSEVDIALGQAAGGASARLEAAMGRVMEKLDGQIAQVGDNLGAMQRAMGEQADRTRAEMDASVSRSAQAQNQAMADLHSAAQTVAERLKAAADEALVAVGQRFAELAVSMRAIEGALTSQKVALEAASGEVRKTAEAFGESAASVRSASAPLISVGSTFSGATQKLSDSVGATLEALTAAKGEIAVLSAGLADTNARSNAFWSGFTAKFDDVDTALGKAVETLAQATQDQQDRLMGYVRAVDAGMTEATGKLASAVTDMNESAEAIADALQSAKAARLTLVPSDGTGAAR